MSDIKPSTEDRVKGTLHEVKGTLKEKVGKLVGDADLEAEGNVEKNTGKVQQVIAKVEKAIGA